MDPNPYAAPESGISPEPESPAVLGELVRGWEKLRLLYNAVLALPGLLVLALLVNRQQMPLQAAIGGGLFFAALANAAFFLGPLSELYLRGWLIGGKPLGRGRWLIFGAGLTVSLGIVLMFAFLALR